MLLWSSLKKNIKNRNKNKNKNKKQGVSTNKHAKPKQ
jgi:hypothetical protein